MSALMSELTSLRNSPSVIGARVVTLRVASTRSPFSRTSIRTAASRSWCAARKAYINGGASRSLFLATICASCRRT